MTFYLSKSTTQNKFEKNFLLASFHRRKEPDPEPEPSRNRIQVQIRSYPFSLENTLYEIQLKYIKKNIGSHTESTLLFYSLSFHMQFHAHLSSQVTADFSFLRGEAFPACSLLLQVESLLMLWSLFDGLPLMLLLGPLSAMLQLRVGATTSSSSTTTSRSSSCGRGGQVASLPGWQEASRCKGWPLAVSWVFRAKGCAALSDANRISPTSPTVNPSSLTWHKIRLYCRCTTSKSVRTGTANRICKHRMAKG
jgi:hypothetical protein